MKNTIIFMIIFIAFELLHCSSFMIAGDYSTIEPGSGIKETAHDLREGQRADGWGYRSLYQRMYNPENIVTSKGIVDAVERITPKSAKSQGILLIVKTEAEDLSVHLGPASFIERQEIKIEKGDSIKVKGSKVTFDGVPTIIAVEINKDDAVLKLRDKNGFPLWDDKGMEKKKSVQ